MPCRAGECDLPAPAWPLFCWVVSVDYPNSGNRSFTKASCHTLPMPAGLCGTPSEATGLITGKQASQGIWMSR